MKKLLGIVLVSLFVGSSGWYWYEHIFPLKEFKRLSEVQFPKGTRVLEWQGEGNTTKGKFQIPENEISGFVAAYKLSDGGYVGSEFLIANSCIHNGGNFVEIRLSKESGIAELEVQSPGITDDNIGCSVN